MFTNPYIYSIKTNTIQKPTNNLCKLKIELKCFRVNKENLLFERTEYKFGFKHTNSVIKSPANSSLTLRTTRFFLYCINSDHSDKWRKAGFLAKSP